MSFLNHAYTGVIVGLAVNRILGLETSTAVAPVLGGVLGAIPDIPKTKSWFHSANTISKIVQWVLLPMPLHTQVFDRLVHPPVLPEVGYTYALDIEVCFIFGKPVTRRDVYWLTAEAMLLCLNTNVLQWLT